MHMQWEHTRRRLIKIGDTALVALSNSEKVAGASSQLQLLLFETTHSTKVQVRFTKANSRIVKEGLKTHWAFTSKTIQRIFH